MSAPRLCASDFAICSFYTGRRVVSRPHGDGTETLTCHGQGFRPLLGADSHCGFTLGEELDLCWVPDGQPQSDGLEARTNAPIFDPWSSAVYFFCGEAIMRLLGKEVMHVAGHIHEEGSADGAGDAARLEAKHCTQMASDGAGSLYFICGKSRIRRVQLPAEWRAGGRKAAAAAVVSTLPLAPPENEVFTLAYLPPAAPQQEPSEHLAAVGGSRLSGGRAGGGGMLVYGTKSALYRLQLPLAPPAASAPAAPRQPEVLAGREGVHALEDGRGAGASFYKIYGVTVDASGHMYLCDKDVHTERSRVRCVTRDGAVTSRITGLPVNLLYPTILPNGDLAALTRDGGQMVIIALGLQPAPLRVSDAGPPPRSLPGDLGALLDAQPDGTSDLTIRVGERLFRCHRAILSARCDYFKQRLADDGFADGRAAELDLPDAEPDAFALLLRWLYTGAVEVPPQHARAAAELGDRLLLPELCEAAQAVLLASVSAESVVEALLWAEARSAAGGRFAALLEALKGWYVRHHDEVRRAAGASRARLAVEAPALHLELVDAAMDAAADSAAVAAAVGGGVAERKRRRS
ncbi:hypothetical protein HYH02_003657 [Chlamydomonas schloesseri]|uniref:BTB domain-containing protein n=1 Tax=Chlamydomonas schloesseri TaxID=2026947 RepID=A0A836B9L5_9CHLO|nr:hypothetical protein HYH02_003657 [Chlamydomonas schloesseri]|eukprot:KAG2451882.1 hypothetical protein HYH02_003657 [Chlamydomonas schloesseri]